VLSLHLCLLSPLGLSSACLFLASSLWLHPKDPSPAPILKRCTKTHKDTDNFFVIP
jgi:hypothetical protein